MNWYWKYQSYEKWKRKIKKKNEMLNLFFFDKYYCQSNSFFPKQYHFVLKVLKTRLFAFTIVFPFFVHWNTTNMFLTFDLFRPFSNISIFWFPWGVPKLHYKQDWSLLVDLNLLLVTIVLYLSGFKFRYPQIIYLNMCHVVDKSVDYLNLIVIFKMLANTYYYAKSPLPFKNSFSYQFLTILLE